jgi:type IV secretion system protein VirB11
MTFRKPSNKTITLEEYAKVGYFDKVKWVSHVDMDAIRSSRLLTDEQKELALALHERRWYDFFCKSVAYHQNILLSGSTGSGKTTFMKALISRIPKDERLISIENVDEIGLYKTHNNSVPLFYSAGGRGIAEVSQKTLLVSSLRMRPDRIFLAELLEGNEAFYYLRNIGSGHPGSITTMHANTAFEAKEQLLLFIKESEAGNNLSEDSVYSFLDKKIHIILQVNRVGTKRIMTQIDYDPLRQYRVQQNVISASLERLERQVSELVEAVKHKETGRV